MKNTPQIPVDARLEAKRASARLRKKKSRALRKAAGITRLQPRTSVACMRVLEALSATSGRTVDSVVINILDHALTSDGRLVETLECGTPAGDNTVRLDLEVPHTLAAKIKACPMTSGEVIGIWIGRQMDVVWEHDPDIGIDPMSAPSCAGVIPYLPELSPVPMHSPAMSAYHRMDNRARKARLGGYANDWDGVSELRNAQAVDTQGAAQGGPVEPRPLSLPRELQRTEKIVVDDEATDEIDLILGADMRAEAAKDALEAKMPQVPLRKPATQAVAGWAEEEAAMVAKYATAH
jgi:hypothetical protein